MKYLITIAVLIMIVIILVSCGSSTTLVDTDDMYKQDIKRDTIITKRVVRRIRPYYEYYTPNYRWYNPYTWNPPFYHAPFYQPRTIIVIPKTETPNYGKRPDRSGGNGGVNIPLNRRRGRD